MAEDNRLNLTVVALVALVAIVSLVSLVLLSESLASMPVATGVESAAAEEQNAQADSSESEEVQEEVNLAEQSYLWAD